MLAQHCVTVHCLIEIGEQTRDSQIHSVICSFLDRQFQECENLLRTIHDQGYSPSMVELFVCNISTMQNCIAFLPDLIKEKSSEDDEAVFEFLVELSSRLVYTYPKHRCSRALTRSIVTRCADKLFEKQKSKSAKRTRVARCRSRPLFAISILKKLVGVAERFPDMSRDILDLFLKTKALIQGEDDTHGPSRQLSMVFSELLEAITNKST